MKSADVEVVVITGMSGAGKTVAVQSFEDLGYYCVDNLPPALLPKFIELIEGGVDKVTKVALVMDLRGQSFFDEFFRAIDSLREEPAERIHIQILYLDAKDAKLVQRYKETRRTHPLAKSGLPLEGIKKERELLEEMKGRAQQIIDTTELKPVQLRSKIMERFSSNVSEAFTVHFVSFGFKYGIPIDADVVFDVRFLPNPHYLDELRPKTGLQSEVSSYVLKWKETKQFLDKLTDLFDFTLPHYKREGKSQVVIGIGCTGGQHRSVTLAEYLADYYNPHYNVYASHRDIDKRKANSL
ncbi:MULTISPECIES: RNase adapter RapZ [Shouchella]|uniref:RNase adapter RapZ n=2 Tax=Shouchella TaxID=2893057 RepID=A0ABY7WCM2_9BACI|nr:MULTISPECIES: RNase adapter RapZ [Shouchella]MED4129073.1 RNase adapter RapZ [Shouchella miscanthi]WDF04410.1 RNase adapter RapZ [Shouchella hunanensis]